MRHPAWQLSNAGFGGVVLAATPISMRRDAREIIMADAPTGRPAGAKNHALCFEISEMKLMMFF